MGITIAEARPPYVTFEVQAVEDRAESEKVGHYVSKDVHFAIITPQGSKDRIVRQVDEWLTQSEQQVQEMRLPETWLKHYKALYAAWREGVAAPVNGTSIRDWAGLSPSQVENLTRARVLTVEDLAAANEETLARIGMGGRSLKDRAVTWLQSTSGEVLELKRQNADLSEKLAKAVAALEAIAAQEEARKQPGYPEEPKVPQTSRKL